MNTSYDLVNKHKRVCLLCQVLLWSRGKSLYEVRKFLGRANPEKFEEIKEERKTSLIDEKIDIFSKEGS